MDVQLSPENGLCPFLSLGMSVSWTLVRIGWHGPGKLLRQLTLNDVVEFAITQDSNEAPVSRMIEELVSLKDAEIERVGPLVDSLAEREPIDADLEFRKWAVVLLLRELASIGADPIYGMIKLTEFWESLEYPHFSPHCIQARESHLSPNDYYSESTFRLTLDEHRRWIQFQLETLTS